MSFISALQINHWPQSLAAKVSTDRSQFSQKQPCPLSLIGGKKTFLKTDQQVQHLLRHEDFYGLIPSTNSSLGKICTRTKLLSEFLSYI